MYVILPLHACTVSKRLRGRIDFCCRQDCEKIDIIYLFCFFFLISIFIYFVVWGKSRIHYKPELMSDKMDPELMSDKMDPPNLRNCK